jgi:hypothetical protein
VREQTNLDFAVMRDAIGQAGPAGPAAADCTPAAPGAQAGLGVRPGPADVPVAGSVVAVYPVPAPADLAPPGGIWDLSVRTAERTVLVRASFGSEDERARVATVGAAVSVVLSGTADVGTLAG